MGTVGDVPDNADVGAFRARMQVELLNCKKWRTRVELANAMFEYLGSDVRGAAPLTVTYPLDTARLAAWAKTSRFNKRGTS